MSNTNEQAKETRFSYCPLCKLKSIYFKAFVGGEDMYICRFCNFAVIANPYSSATKEIKSLEMLEQANDAANQHVLDKQGGVCKSLPDTGGGSRLITWQDCISIENPLYWLEKWDKDEYENCPVYCIQGRDLMASYAADIVNQLFGAVQPEKEGK